MDRKLYIAGAILLVGAVSAAIFLPGKPGGECLNAEFGDGVRAELEVADNRSERRRGLMNRESLEEGTGMIFVYSSEDYRNFWMKNTTIPLDLIYLDSSGEVVGIRQMDPEPGVSEEDLKVYSSEEPARYAIEVNQGFAEEHSVQVGDTVELGNSQKCSF